MTTETTTIRRRGRPPTGQALPARERQRRYMARQRGALQDEIARLTAERDAALVECQRLRDRLARLENAGDSPETTAPARPLTQERIRADLAFCRPAEAPDSDRAGADTLTLVAAPDGPTGGAVEYPAEIKTAALAMLASGMKTPDIRNAILAQHGRAPCAKSFKRILGNWERAAGRP